MNSQELAAARAGAAGLELLPPSGALLRRTVGSRTIDLTELTFGRYALHTGNLDAFCYEAEFTYDDPGGPILSQARAIAEMLKWDGVTEPDGWVRAKYDDGRPTRRREHGDPATEYERE